MPRIRPYAPIQDYEVCSVAGWQHSEALLILPGERTAYLDCMFRADRGDLRPLAQFVQSRIEKQMNAIAENITRLLAGEPAIGPNGESIERDGQPPPAPGGAATRISLATPPGLRH